MRGLEGKVALVTGGSGSAAPKQDEPVKTIFDSLSAANIAYNPTLKAFYDDDSKSGPGRPENPSMASGGVPTLTTGETPEGGNTRQTWIRIRLSVSFSPAAETTGL